MGTGFYFREPFTIFRRTLKSGRKVYYCQFRKKDGTRTAGRSLGTARYSEAVRRANELYEVLFEKKRDDVLFGGFAKGFFDDSSEFVRWKKAMGRAPAESTLRSYRKILELHILPHFKDIPLSDINIALIKRWILEKINELSPKTGNNALSVLNIVLKSAVESGLIPSSPADGLTYRKSERVKRELLTVEEIAAIYRAQWQNESARRLFLVLAITGMRIGEAVGLLASNVSADRLNIEHSMHPKYGLGPTKTRACRVVPVPPRLNLPASCGSVWAFQKPEEDAPVSGAAVYKRFKKICASLNIDMKGRGITIHSLRNFFISYVRASSYGSSIDLKLKAVVGHADSSMTGHYTYWRPEAFSEIYALQEELLMKITGR